MSLLLAALLASTATAPSFDCAHAASPAEHTICADPELAEADRLLATIYAKVRAKAGLRLEQRD